MNATLGRLAIGTIFTVPGGILPCPCRFSVTSKGAGVNVDVQYLCRVHESYGGQRGGWSRTFGASLIVDIEDPLAVALEENFG